MGWNGMWRAGFVVLAGWLMTGSAGAASFVELTAGIHRIEAELAHTAALRTRGLMQRRSLPRNYGMLFVFPEAAKHCMWMRNTPLPLSVAFLDEQGRIINVAEMKPLSDDTHCAEQPARFALEMEAGWFASRGLTAGVGIGGVERAPAAR
jgi:uncharacterized membrane protein (UPF0127 family)